MTRAGRLFRDRAGPCAQALFAKHGYMLFPAPSPSSCWPAPKIVGWTWLVDKAALNSWDATYMYTVYHLPVAWVSGRDSIQSSGCSVHGHVDTRRQGP